MQTRIWEPVQYQTQAAFTDMSMSKSTGPGFRLWVVEASLVRVEHSQSLVQAHNSTHVGHIKNLQCNQTEVMLCH